MAKAAIATAREIPTRWSSITMRTPETTRMISWPNGTDSASSATPSAA